NSLSEVEEFVVMIIYENYQAIKKATQFCVAFFIAQRYGFSSSIMQI
ncbi:MAG: hypothetical protein ACI94Y_002415, partial [Maribacter sp.]